MQNLQEQLMLQELEHTVLEPYFCIKSHLHPSS